MYKFAHLVLQVNNNLSSDLTKEATAMIIVFHKFRYCQFRAKGNVRKAYLPTAAPGATCG